MGLSADEAFDYIVKGAQNGLNYSGELGDNIAEYSQIWGQAGFDAEQMFSILENGTKNGAYNLDKVNVSSKNLQSLFPTEELKKISEAFQKERAKFSKSGRTAKLLHQMFFIALSAI